MRAPAPLGHEWANDTGHDATVTVPLRRRSLDGARWCILNQRDVGSRRHDRHRGRRGGRRVPDVVSPVPPRSESAPTRFSTASRSPARPRPASTSTGCPGRAVRSRTATSGCGNTASSATERKAGSATLCRSKQTWSVDSAGHGRAAFGFVHARATAEEIAEIVASGTPVCVVSSGAIALGMRRVGLTRRPTSLPKLQAASALGQSVAPARVARCAATHGLQDDADPPQPAPRSPSAART